MRITAPLAIAAAGLTVAATAAPAVATTKPTTTAKRSVCKVSKDGRLTVTAKVAKTSRTTGGTELVARAGKTVSKSAFVVNKADSVCVAPGTYTVTLKTTKSTVTIKKVVIKTNTVTRRTVTVR